MRTPRVTRTAKATHSESVGLDYGGSDSSIAESPTPLRVMLLNYEYPPLGGGAGIASQALAAALDRHGVQVDVVTAGSEGLRTDEPVRRAAGPGRVRVYRVDSSRRGVHQAGTKAAVSFVAKARPVIRDLLGRYHYDVAHFFFSLPTGALLPLARTAGVPTVVSLRGSDVPGYDTTNRGLEVAHAVLRPLTRWIWRRADRVVAVTGSLARLASKTEAEVDFQVIGNGVELDVFRPGSARREPGGVVECLAVSRLIPRKGLDTLLEAFRRLPAGLCRLTVVGLGSDSEESRLRQLCTALGLDGSVRFVGAMQHPQLADAYRAADVFTLVPRSEAFGNVFAEALAAGLPIVGAAVGGVTDLVKHGMNGFLVPPDDPETTAAAIRYLADDSRLRRQMEQRNRKKAEAILSWDSVSGRYLSLYREILAETGRATRKVVA